MVTRSHILQRYRTDRRDKWDSAIKAQFDLKSNWAAYELSGNTDLTGTLTFKRRLENADREVRAANDGFIEALSNIKTYEEEYARTVAHHASPSMDILSAAPPVAEPSSTSSDELPPGQEGLGGPGSPKGESTPPGIFTPLPLEPPSVLSALVRNSR